MMASKSLPKMSLNLDVMWHQLNISQLIAESR